MIRAVLLALALALLGGAPYAGIWAAAGNMVDPDRVTTNAGSINDPSGSSSEGDAGGHFDPDG